MTWAGHEVWEDACRRPKRAEAEKSLDEKNGQTTTKAQRPRQTGGWIDWRRRMERGRGGFVDTRVGIVTL